MIYGNALDRHDAVGGVVARRVHSPAHKVTTPSSATAEAGAMAARAKAAEKQEEML